MATKENAKKNTTKGKASAVKTAKTIKTKEVEKNVGVKEIKEVKLKKENKVLNAIKKFFNNPFPLFIAFIAIICGLLIYINKCNTESKIYVGYLSKEDIDVSSIHYFANNDMNYFFASTARYYGEKKDEKIYNYEIGYYVVNSQKEYVPFVTRSMKSDSSATVSTIIEEMSTWDVGELAINPNYFKNTVKPYLSELHFIFKGSTDKTSDDADVVLDYKINLSKITKN